MKAYGAALFILILGFVVGRNVFFSPHGGLGWIMVPLALVVGLVVRVIEIVFSKSPPRIQGISNLFLGFVLFCVVAAMLFALMPNAWNNWLTPDLEIH